MAAFLMLPLPQNFLQEPGTPSPLCFLSLRDTTRYRLYPALQNLHLPNYTCIGAFRGCLVFNNYLGYPFLLNPFNGARIQLPSSSTLPIFHILQQIMPSHIVKVVGSYDAVVVMYRFMYRRSVAFCRHGDIEWRPLEHCDGLDYYDVVVCEETNMVLALGLGPTVEGWDLSQAVPEKRMRVEVPNLPRTTDYPWDLYTTNWYLAAWQGQVLLVVRYTGEYVRDDGVVVSEWDTLSLTDDDDAQPLVYPYRTLHFDVFRLDAADGGRWVDVHSLYDSALFVGGNQSAMVPSTGGGVRRNAIYFTDDYWERMDEDYSYGGHDIGVFNMEDGSIDAILEDDQPGRIDPPPFWIVIPQQTT